MDISTSSVVDLSVGFLNVRAKQHVKSHTDRHAKMFTINVPNNWKCFCYLNAL